MLHVRRTASEHQGERQHRQQAHDADNQVRVAPADRLDQLLHDRRPDGSCEVVATGDERDRKSAPLFKPVRNIGQQRSERRRTAEESDQYPLRQRIQEERRCERGKHIAGAKSQRRTGKREAHAVTVSQPPHHDAAETEANHRQRVRQRSRRTVNAEIRLHRRQCDDDRPHADTAERRHRQRRDQPPPCDGRVDHRFCGVRHARRANLKFSTVSSIRQRRPRHVAAPQLSQQPAATRRR